MWVQTAVAISSSDCTISYESVMGMDLCEISMIYDTLCINNDKIKRDMDK